MKLPLLTVLTCLPLLALANSSSQAPHGSPGWSHNGPGHPGQGPWHGWFDPIREGAHLNERLHLTPGQQGQIKPILENEFDKMKSIQDDSSLSEEQKQEELKTLQQDTDQQIKGLLTPDQIAQLEQMHQGDFACGPLEGPKEFDRLVGALHLTPSQQDEIKPILVDEFEKMKSIQDDTSLSPEQKHQELEALQQDTEQQIKGILTTDQVAQIGRTHIVEQGQGAPPGPPDPENILERLTQMLDLTSSQQEEIKSILEGQFTKINTVREDTSLSQDDRHQQMQALYQDLQKQIEAVLTSDQAAKFAQMHHGGQT